MRLRILFLVVMVCAVLVGQGAVPVWEEVDERHAPVEQVDGDDISIAVKGGYVYVSTARSINVKIFSILGQLVSQQTIPAGTYRLKMATRGVFILKAGTITRRITL